MVGGVEAWKRNAHTDGHDVTGRRKTDCTGDHAILRSLETLPMSKPVRLEFHSVPSYHARSACEPRILENRSMGGREPGLGWLFVRCVAPRGVAVTLFTDPSLLRRKTHRRMVGSALSRSSRNWRQLAKSATGMPTKLAPSDSVLNRPDEGPDRAPAPPFHSPPPGLSAARLARCAVNAATGIRPISPRRGSRLFPPTSSTPSP